MRSRFEEPRAWEGYWSGAGSVNSQTSLTRNRADMERWRKDGAEITPLYAEPRVRVKPLEWGAQTRAPAMPWSETQLRRRIGHHNLGRYAGSYSVQEMSPDGKWGWWCSWTSDHVPEGVEDTEEAAQAACQADYEARIRNAIEVEG